jgi:hypothetical protein
VQDADRKEKDLVKAEKDEETTLATTRPKASRNRSTVSASTVERDP